MRYEFDRNVNGNPREESWGEYDFAAIPAVGSSVRLIRDHTAESGIVGHVEHYPVEHPLPERRSPLPQRTAPTVLVFLDYSGL